MGLGDGGLVDDVPRREASHAIARAQNADGRIMPARGMDGATQGLVDHGGGAAARLSNDQARTLTASPKPRPILHEVAPPARSR